VFDRVVQEGIRQSKSLREFTRNHLCSNKFQIISMGMTPSVLRQEGETDTQKNGH
jgi:hypothetical protein